jgi:hypothetical protein
MASGQELRKHARSERAVGYVSRRAQQRVDRRVMEIMSRRDAAVRRDSPSGQALQRGAASGTPPPTGGAIT